MPSPASVFLLPVLPIFSDIQPDTMEAALKKVITHHRARLGILLAQPTFTWDNFMTPLEEMDDELTHLWNPFAHLYAVVETPALRAAYNACLPLLTDYHTEYMQNEAIYHAIESIANSTEYANFDTGQRKIIENNLRDFKLSGVHLSPSNKALFADLQKSLSKLSAKFSENSSDATHHWIIHITDLNALAGLPESTLQIAEEQARERHLTGWVLTLDYACYASVMKNLVNRELRWLIYEAYVTRASDQGPDANRWDNSAIMDDILEKRHALANLLGFRSYAEYALTTKMAQSASRVLQFISDLIDKSKPSAEAEIEILRGLAKKQDHIESLEAWDVAYYSEQLRQTQLALVEEDLRSYFPIGKVLEGLFIIVNKLYGMTIIQQHGVDVWHPHVTCFAVEDENKVLRGHIYIDLYSRPHKREGAWMDEGRQRRRLRDGSIQLPIAFLICNFAPPLPNQPALLTHDDVLTLFHEFGHCLHHVLTQVDYAAISGINGVPWDAVEFPSQFFEHFCWEKAVLGLIAGHYKTGEPLPDVLFHKLFALKHFQPGLHTLRQLEFALFDFRIHLEYNPGNKNHTIESVDAQITGQVNCQIIGQVQTILNEVRNYIAVFHTPAFNRFQHTFSHIFAGGYAAGYYSYKWSEVLSSDAYVLFKEKGIFDAKTGRAFLKNILEQGGRGDPMSLYIAFRGQEPTIDALLNDLGLITPGLIT